MSTKAKEEAKRIIHEYINIINESDFHIPKFITGISMSNKKYEKVLEEETFELAKQCAINSVNITINELELLWNDFDIKQMYGSSNPIFFKINFWFGVKTQLEELSYEH